MRTATSSPSPSPRPTASSRATDSLLGMLTPEQRLAFEQFSSGRQSSADDPPLFWQKGLPRRRFRTQDITKTASDAMLEFNRWGPTEINAFLDEAKKNHLLGEEAGYFEAKKLWGDLIQEAVDSYGAGKKLSPFDIFSMLGADANRVWAAIEAKDAESKKPYTETNVNSVTHEVTAAEAERTALSVYQSGLGRAPKKGELARVRRTLRAFAAAHPSVSTSKTFVDPGKRFSKTTTSSTGGYNETDAAMGVLDDVQETDEWGSYQAVATYMPAFMSALNAPPTAGD
jgi:hypothetical protein